LFRSEQASEQGDSIRRVAQVSLLRPGVLQEGLGLIPAEDEQRMLAHRWSVGIHLGSNLKFQPDRFFFIFLSLGFLCRRISSGGTDDAGMARFPVEEYSLRGNRCAGGHTSAGSIRAMRTDKNSL
jgi:hypothetical protein